MNLQGKLRKLILPALLLIAIFYLIFFVPPASIYIIYLTVFLISIFFYLLLSVLFSKKTGIFISLTTLFLLTVDYLVGFNYLNTILIISLMVGIKFLIK